VKQIHEPALFSEAFVAKTKWSAYGGRIKLGGRNGGLFYFIKICRQIRKFFISEILTAKLFYDAKLSYRIYLRQMNAIAAYRQQLRCRTFVWSMRSRNKKQKL